jgi:hypothetical protein
MNTVRNCTAYQPHHKEYNTSINVCQVIVIITICNTFGQKALFIRSVLEFTQKGIGEIQSPPSRRNSGESKTAALSQTGVYAVGQFAQGAREAMPACFLSSYMRHRNKPTSNAAIPPHE